MPTSSRTSALIALLTLTLFLLSSLTPSASATTSLTCYKGNAVKIVKTKTCPAGYSKTKPTPPKPVSKTATYYGASLSVKKTFLDPRTSKNIPAPVIEFWKNSNEIAYYVYADNQDELSAQAYNNNVWYIAINQGYQPQATLDSSNAAQVGQWFRTDNSPAFVTPQTAPCSKPGDSIRYLDLSYTCMDGLVYGIARDITTLTAAQIATLNPISGDGYDPNLPAVPGRRCSTKNASATLYGVNLTCIFMSGTLIPQTSTVITLVNTTTKTEYCFIDEASLVKKTKPESYITLALITSSCNSYLKTNPLLPSK